MVCTPSSKSVRKAWSPASMLGMSDFMPKALTCLYRVLNGLVVAQLRTSESMCAGNFSGMEI